MCQATTIAEILGGSKPPPYAATRTLRKISGHQNYRLKGYKKRKGVTDMNVDFIFKIAAVGIIVAVLNQVLIRSGREEQAMMTTLAGLVVVLMMIIQEISVLFRTVKTLFGL